MSGRCTPGGRTVPVLAVALALALVLSGCSAKSKKTPTPAARLTATGAYEKAVVGDGAAGFWSLRDATKLSPQDEVADLTTSGTPGVVIGGTIARTTGPAGGVAAQFLRSGRIVTPISSGLASSDTFSVELDLRNDRCVSAWGRVLGTTSLPKQGREGFELLHFPKQFKVSPCRFGVEFWHQNKYVGGCLPKGVPAVGTWEHWAIVYGAGRVSCYLNGALFETNVLRAPQLFSQLGPLGIGGSGSGFQGPLDGASLSEVAFYRRALTRAEVVRHATLARAVSASAPTARPTAS